MKKQILVVSAILFFGIYLKAQSCFPGGIGFSTQAHIDNFAANYPGCFVVEGDVVIQGSSINNLNGLSQITAINGSLDITGTVQFDSLAGLENLVSIGGNLQIKNTIGLQSLKGLNNLEFIGGDLFIAPISFIPDLSGLNSLVTIGGSFRIYRSLGSFEGLESLTTIAGSFLIGGANGADYSSDLIDLSGLASLSYIGGDLRLENNADLVSLAGLGILTVGGDVSLWYNPLLSHCAVTTICNYISQQPENIDIDYNAPGCDNPAEVEAECNGHPIIVTVLMELDGDCQPDMESIPASGIQVRYNGGEYMATRPANEAGVVEFGNFEAGPFFLSLPQFPTEVWGLCQDTIWVTPANLTDTILATFLLQPLTDCPDLAVELGLPSSFRSCLTTSDMQVEIRNVGAVVAENLEVAVVLPLTVLDVEDSSLPISAQNGDTLFFIIENLNLFETAIIDLTVRTQCDTFLFGQTLCVEAFAFASNSCPPEPETFSEIRLYSQCIDDETVRFILKNIGNAPTQSLHEYVIIEDEVILMMDDFTLDPHEERTVDLPANGSTYRMEATRFSNGTLTAIALENCGGLSPGLITAYWLDEGLENYDYDCREVTGSYDPNQKSAIPKGVGEEHLLPANRRIQYTIEFQNTGNDTAYRVLLTDILSPHLDINTFRPGFSSHPYSWEIRGLDTLDVLFFPIALPDSNVNLTGSQGFFTFDIDQKPDLPNGTVIQNTADIVFDFNPPIVTNTVFHTIGELYVIIEDPAYQPERLWNAYANPVNTTATFEAIRYISGIKRFELFDAAGRKVRTESFAGQEFLFQRAGLVGGLYFFRITDEQGKASSGKIIVAE
ncbi:MAG: T9SS type A sorting domain-containing protein [Saprospiraceae bacterium]